ncbi:MAG: ribosomal protein S18-alanine N-acetyltransferase [Thermodesulfobacteriota bacterium]
MTTSSWIILPAEDKDLAALVEIEKASFAQPWSWDTFRFEMQKTPPTLYTARAEARAPIEGYLCFWPAAGEIQLLNLAVHPQARRQGTGRALMEFLLTQAGAQGVGKIFLEVRPSNGPATTLYKALGFKTLYRRPGYYPPEGEEALVMEWTAQ